MIKHKKLKQVDELAPGHAPFSAKAVVALVSFGSHLANCTRLG